MVRAINEGLTAKHGTFIAEMGAYRRGDVAELCELVHPRIGVLTAIGPAHLERFGSLDAIEQAKGELAEGVPADGTFITTADDERCLRTTERTHARRVVLFSCGGLGPRRRAGGADRDGRGHDEVRVPTRRDEAVSVRSKLLGQAQRREPARGRGGRGSASSSRSTPSPGHFRA